MAIYSTFFLAQAEQLAPAFAGWKPPLAAPVTRTFTNPFTRQEQTITTRDPDWEDFDPESFDLDAPQVVAIEGDYAEYLKSRIPPFVRSQPHWCATDLTNVELDPLIAAAGVPDAKLESALYAHPALGCGLEQFPDRFLARLKEASEAELQALAARWAKIMSTPDYTHSASGERLSDDWRVEDALCLVTSLADLSKRHAPGQHLYLLIES